MTDIKIEDLVKRGKELEALKTEVEQELAAVKAQVRALGLGKHVTGAGPVTISANRRFNPELAEQVLGAINPDLLTACRISVVDSKTVKAKVGDEIYQRCMKIVGEHKVSFG